MTISNRAKLLAGMAAVAAAAAASSPAIAQKASAQTQAAQESAGEIVVTAEKREQSLQAVPASVAAIGQTELERQKITQLSDYLTAVPGIDYSFAQGPTGARGRQTIGIRGVERTGGLESSAIGFYIDETSIDVANPRIFDLNRIEVLRGPQGTLYGASSVGGTIKLVSNQPNLNAASFETETGFSSVQDGGVGGEFNQMVNLPLIQDKVALRLVGTLQNDPGYVDNYGRTGAVVARDVNGSHAREVRASLLIAPTDKLEITPSVYYHVLYQDQAPDQVAGGGLPKRSVQIFDSTASKEEFTLVGLNVRYDLGFADFVSQTSHYNFASGSHEDLTLSFAPLTNYLPVGIYSTTFENSFSEEDRIVSKLKGPIQFVAGVYYDDDQRPFTSDSITPGLNAALAANHVPITLPTTPAGDNYYDVVSTDDQRQYAAFGELTYSPIRSLDLNVGLRYFDFESHSGNRFNGYLFRNLPPLAPGHASESGLNPKINVTWRPTDDLLFYATVDRGFRPGNADIPLPSSCNADLTASGITPPGPDSFKSDSLWNYEGGAKTSWFDRKVTADLTGYVMDWTNIQVVVPLPSCQISGYIVNAGNARSEGAEFELTAHPVSALQMTFNAAYSDAYLTSASRVLKAAAGTMLLDTPRWSMSGSAQYSFPLGSDLQGYLHGDVRYRDKTELDYTGRNEAQAFTQVDLRAGILGDRPLRSWELAVYVQNLADVNPVLSRSPRATLGGYQFISIDPRTVGMNLTLHY